MMLTNEQKTEFYNGFIEALLWSTGGQPDYSEAPGGYRILDDVIGPYRWQTDDSDSGRGFDTEREAIAAAREDAGEEPPTLDGLEGFELADITARRLREFTDAWADHNAELLQQYIARCPGILRKSHRLSLAGHDLALTANGHGTGFWGRGLGELGDALTHAATRDYCSLPEGYSISWDGLLEGWIVWKAGECVTPSVAGTSKYVAIRAAWDYADSEPPGRLGTMFEAYIGDDGLVYVEGFTS